MSEVSERNTPDSPGPGPPPEGDDGEMSMSRPMAGASTGPTGAHAAIPTEVIAGPRRRSEPAAGMTAGDEMALAVLYHRWSRVVRAHAAELLRGRHDAEDVLEETSWRAWRQASRNDPARDTVATWLLTIASSRSLHQLRARRQHREASLTPVPLRSPHATGEANSESTAQRVEALARRTVAAAALQKVEPNIKTLTRLTAQRLRDFLLASWGANPAPTHQPEDDTPHVSPSEDP